MDRHVLVAGASGVIGSAAVERFAGRPGWRVTALSRRRPVLPDACRYDHVALDLSDRAACRDALRRLPPVTHIVYAAVAEASGLVSGWYDDELIAANGRMFENCLDPLAAGGRLVHLGLLQGAKAYGAHHHPVELPAREDRPRDPHPNFYWLHEDHARRRQAEAGFALTVFRPQVVVGGAAGVAMNPAIAIGAYAAIAGALGRPFAYPGAPNAVMELVDSGLIADALEWAADTPAAANRTFNLTNGDAFVPAHAWPQIARVLGLSTDGAPPPSLVSFFADPEAERAWAALVARHGLREPSLPALLGEAHHYVDLLLSRRLADRAVPMTLSTIRVRQAGFAGCRDSLDSLIHWIGRLVSARLLPPMGDLA